MQEDMADALKGVSSINQDNIKECIRRFAVRGIQVDRKGVGTDLVYFNVRKGIRHEMTVEQATELNETVPTVKSFHMEAVYFLKQVVAIYSNVSFNVTVLEDKDSYLNVVSILRTHLFPAIDDRDAPNVRSRPKTSSTLEIVATFEQDGSLRLVDDRGAEIRLQGSSEVTLKYVKSRLHAIGFKNVAIELNRITPSFVEYVSYFFSRLASEFLTINNLSKFIWTLLGIVLGFLLRQVTL